MALAQEDQRNGLRPSRRPPEKAEQKSGVLVLHEVLLAELGDWQPANDKNLADWQEYKELARQARVARTAWTNPSATKQSRIACQTAYDEMLAAEQRCLIPLYRILGEQQRSALCFSGGGIRSATFSLGIIHALAKYSFTGEPAGEPARLLAEFDYLSTVSGGGYIGSWLSAWIKHAGSTDAVARQLARTPTDKLDPEPPPLLHLRNYSNYLNPRLGLFSADTWTLATTAVRNILLNWLVLIPFLAAVLLLPVLFEQLVRFVPAALSGPDPFLLAGFVSGALGTAFIMYNLPSFGNGKIGENGFLWGCLLPLAVSAVCLTLWWGWQGQSVVSHLAFAVFGAGMHGAGVIMGALGSLRLSSTKVPKNNLPFWHVCLSLLFGMATGFIGALLLSCLASSISPLVIGPVLYTCWGVPLVFMTLAFVGVLSVGISSKITDDDDREWWSRAGAWVLIVSLGWLAVSSLVLLLPDWIKTLSWRWSVSFSAVSGFLGWLVSQLGSSQRSGPETSGDKSAAGKSNILPTGRQWLLPTAAVLFLVALSCGVALLNEYLTKRLGRGGNYLILMELAFAIFMSYAVNVNKFSLHAMYRIRLVRAYLAASRMEQDPNPFTGFDLDDNLPMHALPPGKPLHVLNLCLNLVHGSKLAWQQRKAESFTVTRLHAGSFRVGYQPAATYGQGPKHDGITLGTAMTISGAAASPNMGYHSSPLTALVMTLFNARLGWWLANPGEPGRGFWKDNGPAFGIRPILDEALGNTTDANRYVYLSDGGHFENLGLYEMVLRRCRFIVVVDAGADPQYTKEDLGNAVRKIRIDLGIPIEFPAFAQGLPTDPSLGAQAKHCALGKIHYNCVDKGAADGLLLYIKPLLTGDEPADVLHYASSHPFFPQQSTGDQWFNESQFESYRRLGAHTIEAVVGSDAKACSVEDLFEAAQNYLGISATKIKAASAASIAL